MQHHSWKEHMRISKIAKFGGKILQNKDNMASQSLHILYGIILRKWIFTYPVGK
jgi:hypothetical protein